MTAYLSLINGKNSSTLKLVLFRDTGILGNQEHCSSPEVNKLCPTRAWLPIKSTDVYNTMHNITYTQICITPAYAHRLVSVWLDL